MVVAALQQLSTVPDDSMGKAALNCRLKDLIKEVSPGIYAFDMFTHAFCGMLVASVDSWEASGLPRRRPNTMNNYGLIMHEVGMQRCMDMLLQLVAPLAALMFPEEPVAFGLDHHHSFVVQYKSDHKIGDRGLVRRVYPLL